MGRQQRNRHPTNRLGRRRSPRVGDVRSETAPGNLRSGPDPVAPGEELPTAHRPVGRNSPHQS